MDIERELDFERIREARKIIPDGTALNDGIE